MSVVGDKVARLFGMEFLGTGAHRIRDAAGNVVDEFHAELAWHARVLPSFDVPATLAVVTATEWTRGVMLINDEDPDVGRSRQLVNLRGWSDTVVAALRSQDLAPLQFRLFEEGVGYELLMSTPALSSRIAFANPVAGELLALEVALLEAGAELADAYGDPAARAYVGKWREFVGHRAQ